MLNSCRSSRMRRVGNGIRITRSDWPRVRIVRPWSKSLQHWSTGTKAEQEGGCTSHCCCYCNHCGHCSASWDYFNHEAAWCTSLGSRVEHSCWGFWMISLAIFLCTWCRHSFVIFWGTWCHLCLYVYIMPLGFIYIMPSIFSLHYFLELSCLQKLSFTKSVRTNLCRTVFEWCYLDF